MSVLIKGMEMPKNCYDCPFAMRRYETLFVNGKSIRRDYGCVFTHRAITSTKRNRFCPLIPVPVHGRLIDADALGADLLYDAELCARALDSGDIVDSKEAEDLQWQKDCKQNCAYYLTNAETIIEAEEGKI